MRRSVAIFMLAVMMLCALPVSAAEQVVFFASFGGIEGAAFEIYLVAEPKDGAYVPTGDFADIPVDLSDPDSAAVTLAGFVQSENIEPTATAVTDSNGIAAFGQVDKGMYLLLGQVVQQGDQLLTPMPVLLTLTESATAEVKFERTDAGEPLTLGVLKQWAGRDNQRPSQVTVTLYCDGAVEDTVVLNQDNTWRHVWTDLDAGHSYQVVEVDVPDNYTVSVILSGGWFTVTNTYDPQTSPPTLLPLLPPVRISCPRRVNSGGLCPCWQAWACCASPPDGSW